MTAKVGVIGSGFAGLSASITLASKGHDVTVFEKNSEPGGRARQWNEGGYVFDMGPSWYWMPDVMEDFFALHGKDIKDYMELQLLDPAFTIFFGEGEQLDVPGNTEDLKEMFESLETGAGKAFDKFMKGARHKYEVGMKDLVYKPSHSITEFMTLPVMRGAMKLDLFTSFSRHVRKYFSHPWLIALMEFPVLFLGAKPEKTPALYSLMNYAGLCLGTWYPKGGFGSLVSAMVTLGKELGVEYRFNEPVESLRPGALNQTEIVTHQGVFTANAVVGAADYNHIEQQLLPARMRSYSREFWSKKTMAPSCLLFYVGINQKIDGLNHHNLFFDADFDQHANAIYDTGEWPEDPLFYVCCPSKTDNSVAPKGSENIFILMPLAPGSEDTSELRDRYFDLLMARLEAQVGGSIVPHIELKRSYCVNDFSEDYNSFKGNAYGLANTLRQTAILRPKMKSRKMDNLFYAGQLTVPGPGVPPAIISGEVAGNEVNQYLLTGK